MGLVLGHKPRTVFLIMRFIDLLTVIRAACCLLYLACLSVQHLVYCCGSWQRTACLRIRELIWLKSIICWSEDTGWSAQLAARLTCISSWGNVCNVFQTACVLLIFIHEKVR